MLKTKKFHGILLGISVLPALIICTAHAENSFALVGNNGKLEINPGDVYQNLTSDNSGIGGAIVSSKPSGSVIINGEEGNFVEFTNNSAKYDGGAIGNYGKLSADYVKFTGNTSQTGESDWRPIGGGAISLGVDSQTTISNSKFENNETGYNGGAIGTRRTLQASEEANPARNSLKISDSDFTGNKANGTTKDTDNGQKVGGYGGAIANTFETTTVTKSTFTGNEATNGGGAIYLTGFLKADVKDKGMPTGSGGKLAITDSGFTGNESGQGGAILSGTSAQELTVTGSEFTDNKAVYGGAAIWSGAKTNIENSKFSDNEITGSLYTDDMADDNSEGGAAIFVGSSSHTTVKGSTFKNNKSGTVGGAIATRADSNGTKSSLTIEDSTFTGNQAEVTGGAINIASQHENVVFKGNNSFTGNTAKQGGADIFNNGKMTIENGTTTIDGGIEGAGTLTIANGATLNIGDAIVEQKSITLYGNMIANLTDRGEKAIVTADEFGGDGKMSLIAKAGGEYKVFGRAIFGGEKEIQTESALFNQEWNEDGTVKLDLKSIEDIASDNNLSAEASQTVANLVNSTSDKLNDFGLLVQESLSNGDVAAVEKAHKAINPEKTSAVQSVSSYVQGTVAKLAANRMSTPSVGRSGGDVDITAGGVWAQGLFNKSKLNGEFNGYTRGVAAGIDGTLGRAFTIGAGYAFNHSDLGMNSRDTEIDSNTVFVYGQYKPSLWYVNGTLNYTMSDYTEKSSALGVAIDSDYNVNSFGGQVMTGYDFANGFTPEMGVRYMHIAGDSYTNSLGIKNKIDNADYLTAILGGKYAKSFAISDDLALRPEVRLAAKYDLMSDDAVTTVAMPGVVAYSVNGDRLNRFGGEAGLGITMSYKEMDLSLTYDIEVRKDYTSQTGMVRARYNF